jgi:hypothetical protein
MALEGIGSGGGSALERFQALRDSAKKKIDVGEGRADLVELIKRKQAQMGAGGGASSPVPGNAAKTLAGRILSGFAPLRGDAANLAPASGPALGSQAANGNAASAALAATSGPSAYGRSGGLQKQDSRPTLGRHVDFMA